MLLDTGAGTPLYEQLKQALMADIKRDRYTYGQQLPTEAQLSAYYGVSRITVRRAVADLVAEGYLAAQQGKGTYVLYKKEKLQFRTFGGFAETFDDGSYNRHSVVLKKEHVPADKTVASALEIPLGERVLYVNRLMFTDQTPHLLDHAYFIDRLYPGISDRIVDDVSTFQLIWNDYDQIFTRAEKTLGAVRAGVEEAGHLGCVPGDPLLRISKIIFGRNDTPIHYSCYYLRADSCAYTISVSGKQSDIALHLHETGQGE